MTFKQLKFQNIVLVSIIFTSFPLFAMDAQKSDSAQLIELVTTKRAMVTANKIIADQQKVIKDLQDKVQRYIKVNEKWVKWRENSVVFDIEDWKKMKAYDIEDAELLEEHLEKYYQLLLAGKTRISEFRKLLVSNKKALKEMLDADSHTKKDSWRLLARELIEDLEPMFDIKKKFDYSEALEIVEDLEGWDGRLIEYQNKKQKKTKGVKIVGALAQQSMNEQKSKKADASDSKSNT